MTTAIQQKLKREIKQELIREFILPLLRRSKDAEGEYRDEFLREIARASKEKPSYRYHPKSFLKLIS